MAYRSRFAAPPPDRRLGRLRIFLPSLVLLGLGFIVAGFWTYASWRTEREIDAWIRREAALGRIWTCPRQKIGGFPFRIEVRCVEPGFEGRDINGGLRAIVALAQVYDPRHIIAEAEGPLLLRDLRNGASASLGWDRLRVSLIGKPGAALERLSLEAANPSLAASGPGGTFSAQAQGLEAHLRRSNAAPAEAGSFEIATTLNGAQIPILHAWLRGSDPFDFTLEGNVTQAEPLAGEGLHAALERWREAGGTLTVSRATLVRGGQRIEATGNLALDGARRPVGRLDVSLTGLGTILSSLGLDSAAGGLGDLAAGVIRGRPRAGEPTPEASGGTKPVTLRLRLEGGKVLLGPFPVATLPPLY